MHKVRCASGEFKSKLLSYLSTSTTFEELKTAIDAHRLLMIMEINDKGNTPLFSPNLFWDVNAGDLDMEKHEAFIINRVLDYGQWDDWKIILDYYGLEQIASTAKNLRSLFPKSLAFISTVSRTPENQFRCYELLQSKNKLWHF